MTCIPGAFSNVVERAELPEHLRDIGVVRGADGLVFTPRHSFISPPHGVPGYLFDVTHAADGRTLGVGCVSFAADSDLVARGGHIGVEVAPEFRSQGYGAAFVRGLAPLLRDKGISEALLTVASGHEAAAQTCRDAGARYLDDLPPAAPGEKGVTRFLLPL